MKLLIIASVLTLSACGSNEFTSSHVTPQLVQQAVELCASNSGWKYVFNVADYTNGPTRFSVRCKNDALFQSVGVQK